MKISGDDELKLMITGHLDFLKERTNSKKIDFIVDKLKESDKNVFTIKGKHIRFKFS